MSVKNECAKIRRKAKSAGRKPSVKALKAAGCRVPKAKKRSSSRKRTLIAVKPGEIMSLAKWLKSQGFKGLAGHRMRRAR